MNKLKLYLTGFDFLKDIFLIFLGMIIPNLCTLANSKLKKAKYNKELKNTSNSYDKNGIMSLDHGSPYYEPHNITSNKNKDEFYLSVPKEKLESILKEDKNFISRDDKYFDKNNLDELGNELDIPNFTEIVEKHRKIVADEFLESAKRKEISFNGKKFGIKSISMNRVTEEENSYLNIDFYTTDYFTHKVMKSVYKEIKEHYIKFDETLKEKLNDYYPFMTSLGINTLVILDKHSYDKQIVFCRRSKRVSNMNGQSKWHVSMNEGVSVTDLDGYSINLNKAVKRGMYEELGIKENDVKKSAFGDLFIVTDNFEIGLTNIVILNRNFEELKTCYNTAQDSVLETEDIKSIRFSKQELTDFLSKNSTDMTLVCKYSIDMIIGRGMNIDLP